MSTKRFKDSPYKVSLIIASLAGLGYAPVASGTVGTLGAVVIHYLFLAGLPPLTYFLLWLILFEIACYTAHMIRSWTGENDPAIVVVDEAVGYFAAMFMIPPTALFILGAFILFRFFDVVKAWPANHFDRKVKSGLGVVLDDVVAGIYTNLLLHFINWLAS